MNRKQLEDIVSKVSPEDTKNMFETMVRYLANFVNLDDATEGKLVSYLEELRDATKNAGEGIIFFFDTIENALKARD